jgi:hypothetical protein
VRYAHFLYLSSNFSHHGSGGTAVGKTHTFFPVKVSN